MRRKTYGRLKYGEMLSLPGFIDTSKKRRKKAVEGFRGKERDLQSMCEQYLELNRIMYFHLPDHLMQYFFGPAIHNIPIEIRREVKEYLVDWMDLIMFDKGRYLAVELKTATGKLTRGQKIRLDALGGHVIRSFDDFKKLVDDWIDGKSCGMQHG